MDEGEKNLINIATRRPLQNPAVLIGGPTPAYEKAREKYPLISKSERSKYQLEGGILISDFPLASKGGLMEALESIPEKSENIRDQIKSALITGAASELAGIVLGDPGNIRRVDKDQKLWLERFNIEETYLFKLLEDREKVIPHIYDEKKEAAVISLNRIIEYANTLNDEKRMDYLKKIAKDRAIEGLGIMNEEKADEAIVAHREKMELEYLLGAVEPNRLSHGRKNLSEIK